jgi:hypothetical protein
LASGCAHRKLAKAKVYFPIRLAASQASGWAETCHLKPQFYDNILSEKAR